MKKVETKKFGLKNLLKKTPIAGTDELFIGEISYTGNGSRYRIQGIIDYEGREVVPFGDLNWVIGTRIVNDDIVIIDCEAVAGNYNIGWTPDYGSLLLMKYYGRYKLAYNSNASVMLVTDHMLLGANYEASVEDAYYSQYDDTSYPVVTFEYDYKKGQLVKREKLGEVYEDELRKYFNPTTLPHPMRTLRKRKPSDL